MTEQTTSKRSKVDANRRLLGYLRPYGLQLFIAYIAMLLGTGLNLIVPKIIAWAIDLGLAEGKATTLLKAGAIILGIAVVRGGLGFLQRFYGEWLTHRVAYDLRSDFYNAVQYQPFEFHDQSHTGDLMSRATSDISEAQQFAGIGLMDLSASLLLLGGVIIAMLLQSVPLALLAMIPFPILLIVTIRFGMTVEPMFKRIQYQMGILSTVMQESLTGIHVVKAFAREPHELGKFDRENNEWYAQRADVIKTWGNNWPFMTFLIMMSIFLLLFFAGPAALRGDISVGSLFALISYVLMLNTPVQRLGFLVNLAATAGASASRVFEIIDLPREVVDLPNAIALKDPVGDIKFEEVSFNYHGGPPVLQDVTFHAHAGERIALIGPTGSGKSTITHLIPRFYDVTEGRILVDDFDVRDLQLKSLRGIIGIVLQESFLFSQTVGENIAYGRLDATMDEIVAAARIARAHDFIMELEDGYDTRVGERGTTLSGGQRQRIAIARAVLADPRILILDDSTSSVDTETEYLIQEALSELMVGRTTFIIAQRLLTLKHADRIFVLQNGQIVERGTHDELLANEGLYRQIYDLQLKDQEEFVVLQDRMAAKGGI